MRSRLVRVVVVGVAILPATRLGAQEVGDTTGVIGLQAALSPNSAAQLSGSIDPSERFQAGNLHYQQGDFELALEAYTQILAAGYESGDLHYNLGNTHFKLGQIGPAILSYERARRDMPRDENVLANLALARSLTADQITPLPGFWLTQAWDRWLHLFPRGTLIALVGIGYLLCMAIVILRVLRGADRTPGLGRAVVGLAVITAILGINLGIREFGLGGADYGVVMSTETPVHSAPVDDPSLQLFSIHEGTRVRIDRRSDGWAEVVLDDGKVGWLKSDAISVI